LVSSVVLDLFPANLYIYSQPFHLHHHSTVAILVVGADQEDRLVFLHVPLMLAQVHLFKPMVELVANLVIHHFPNVVEAVVEEV